MRIEGGRTTGATIYLDGTDQLRGHIFDHCTIHYPDDTAIAQFSECLFTYCTILRDGAPMHIGIRPLREADDLELRG